MRNACLKSLVVAGAALVAIVQTHAQPLFPEADSIEATVANADFVLIAKLTGFRQQEQTQLGDGFDAAVQVVETLKHDSSTYEPYTRLSIHFPQAESLLKSWQDRSCPLLVAYNYDAPDKTTVIELTPGNLEIMTADFTLLREPEDVIEAARETVRRMPASIKRIHTFRLPVPRDVIAGTQWESYYDTGGYLLLSVPVDKQLEEKAQVFIRSDDYPTRVRGVEILRYFQSNDNIKRLRGLLDDPGRAVTHLPPTDDSENVEERIYGVRQRAYQVLQTWGIDTEKPVNQGNVSDSDG